MPVIATSAAALLPQLANSVSQISDTNKRRKFEQNLASLSLTQKKALDAELAKQNSDAARQQLLADTIGTASKTRIEALVASQTDSNKTKRYLIIGGVALAGVLVLALVIIKIRKR